MTEQTSGASLATGMINLRRAISAWRVRDWSAEATQTHKQVAHLKVPARPRTASRQRAEVQKNKNAAHPFNKIQQMFHSQGLFRYESINNRDTKIRRLKLKRQTAAPSAAAKTMNSKCIWWRRER